MILRNFCAYAILVLSAGFALAQQSEAPPVFIDGASLQIAIDTGHENRSEAGIGASLPRAYRLWFVAYVAHIRGEVT